jgi:cytochrome P450
VSTAFDPASAAFAQDPYPVYAALRATPGPVHHDGLAAWLLARYADVDAVARDPRFLRSPPPEARDSEARPFAMPVFDRFVRSNLLELDGTEHDRLRRIVMRALTRRRVQALRAGIERFVDLCLDPLLGAGEVDFVTTLAEVIPGHVIGALLGVPEADRPLLRAWSADVVQFYDADRSATDAARAEQAASEFRRYLEDLVAARRQVPREDLVSELVAAERAGDLDATELVATAMLLLMAGHGSTTDLLGLGLLALTDHPEELARLRAAPTLAPTAAQEMLRFATPLPYFHRHAAEAVVVAGRRFEAGTRFGLLYGAANRDPGAFPDPDRFDVGRQPNRHLAFGRGAHLCLGNHLSRLDAEIVFTRLLARTRDIERTGGTVAMRPSLTARGPLSLPVRLLPA